MLEAEFEVLKARIMNRLSNELPGHLHYHCPEHTERVLTAAEYIAIREKIKGRDLLLLKIAVLYHDIGFLKTYENHEEEGIRIAKEELALMNLPGEEIDMICGMIQATRIPQTVQNKLEAVMADADLEYLGTADFEQISDGLYRELLFRNPELKPQEWNRIQVQFLENHSYFTDFGKNYLEPVKQIHLQKLKSMLQ